MDLYKALITAVKAHSGQKDKAGLDYISHPVWLALQMDDEESRIVALLHDVVEDSATTADDLAAEGFGDRIVDAVKCLTHSESEDYFEYIRRVSENALARKVKIADLTHNSDLSRLPEIKPSDIARAEKYRKALELLGNR